MKGSQLLFLTLVMLQGAGSGCHSASKPVQFSEVPDYMVGRTKPREAMVDLEITGAKPGLQEMALAAGIRKGMGPSSNVYPEPEMMRDAHKLANLVLARQKATLRLPRDLANSMAHDLEQAGLIVKLSE